MTHIYCFCGRELLGDERERAIKQLPYKWNYSVVEYVRCNVCIAQANTEGWPACELIEEPLELRKPSS